MTLTKTAIDIATAQIADACVRLKTPFRVAPQGIRPVVQLKTMIYGPAVPVRHYGSVDVFFEALMPTAETGIMVIDNGGRTDEACIGDLSVVEVKNAGLQAMVVWGLHRDTTELMEMQYPVFTYGTCPVGPTRLDEREADALKTARFGDFLVSGQDTVFADQDGVIFLETKYVDSVLGLASTIRTREQEQAKIAVNGTSMREQFRFQEFLNKRDADNSYTFRKHLSSISKSIEE